MDLDTRVDRLEELVAQLAVTAARADARMEQLAAAQERTETRLVELGAAVKDLAAAQSRTEARLEELGTAVRVLAAAQSRTEAQLEQLTAAQARTEARLEELGTAVKELAAAQARTEAQLEQLTAAQARTESQLGTLIAWQQGERGRREGELHERDTIRHAAVLFRGGDGGNVDRDFVRRRVTEALVRAMSPEDGLTPERDPSLSDMLWWKGDRVAVVEISRVIERHDIDRAVWRAQTLRRAGLDAFPAVIGLAWADEGVLAHAEAFRMAWHVGDSVSEPFIAFRRRPHELPADRRFTPRQRP